MKVLLCESIVGDHNSIDRARMTRCVPDPEELHSLTFAFFGQDSDKMSDRFISPTS